MFTRHVGITAVAALVALAAVGSARAGVSLGASFGYTHLSYPNVQDFTNDAVGIPGSAEWGQPGFRAGYLSTGGVWDLNLDVGLLHRSSKYFFDETTLELLPQVQANMRTGRGFDPFVNVGAGIEHETAPTSATSTVSGTRPAYGVGLGVRKFVSEHHGLVRLELRYDYLAEQVKELGPFESITFPATNMLSVKFGFDLLVGK